MYDLEEETLMKKYIKKLISIPSILAISISLLTACSVPQSEPTPSPSEKSANETVYAFVGKDIQNPYSQKVFRLNLFLMTIPIFRIGNVYNKTINGNHKISYIAPTKTYL